MDQNISDNDFFELLKIRYGIVGRSHKMRELIKTLLQAAPTDLTVLITGETGTGKEVFANAIHGMSKRRKNPFVSVNCGAIPENLLESELFGHEKGAFTGADSLREGFFEAANTGTIFLDEIGEMPVNTQVKLLRVLESGEYSRLGSSQVRKVDVRVIAATNRKLEQHVMEGEFRQDLYYRLKSVHLELPALREHPDDIPLLADFFAERTSQKLAIDFKGISEDAQNILKSLHWKGNVRELRNMIETVITLEKADYITPELISKYIPRALPAYVAKDMDREKSLIFRDRGDGDESQLEPGLIFRTLLEIKNDIGDVKRSIAHLYSQMDDIRESTERIRIQTTEEIRHNEDSIYNHNLDLAEMEKKLIEAALKKYNGNRRHAAHELGISERTLYRKIADYELNEGG